jgi:hypothetical protein
VNPPGPLLIGRIVHYVSYGTPGGEYGSECRAAIVTEVDHYLDPASTASLTVFNPSGLFLNQKCPHADFSPTEPVGGSWHWPHGVVS